MNPVTWTVQATSGSARCGVMSTPHGTIATPAFMPVGTRGAVRGIDRDDLSACGAEIMLSNAYHLMLRPGEQVVKKLGGLHDFAAWSRPILTDSGGFQIFSLSSKVTEDGVAFRSTYDGSHLMLTPERAIQVQEDLGSDIAMVLDVLVGLPAEPAVLADALERTLRWTERAIGARRRDDRALFGIVQGGVDVELRRRSARGTASLAVDGFGIGGLSVGESAAERNTAIEATVPELPTDKIRYVMGLGDTEGMLDAITRGIDLFDCVLPTRLARHGKVLSRDGDYSIKKTEWTSSPDPLMEDCPCFACRTYSRGYIRHLFNTKELLGMRLATIHNLTYTLGLMSDARQAIVENRYAAFASSAKSRRARDF
jgi:queuine tRNA-ribosyltransferase